MSVEKQQCCSCFRIVSTRARDMRRISRAGHIAAACTSRVTIFALPNLRETWQGEWCQVGSFQPAEPVTSLAWAAPSATQQMPALWASGSSLSLWQPTVHPLMRVALRAVFRLVMAASWTASSLFIGQHDRLVKVWAQGADEFNGASFGFCYLRHPDAVASIAWRPPEGTRKAMHNASRRCSSVDVVRQRCAAPMAHVASPEPMPPACFSAQLLRQA